MALVEVARFNDATEAQVAAAALRASDIAVLVQNEHWGQNQFYMQIAMGGFRLWTPAEDAAAAKAFIRECQSADPQALKWSVQRGSIGGLPMVALSLLLFLVGGLAWGWTVATARRGPTVARILVVAVLGALAVGGWWALLSLAATDGGPS
jgi:hypothetical protein